MLCSFESEKVFQHQGKIIRAKITEHVPPDPVAALRILERLDPEQWKERTEVENKGGFNLADLVELSMKTGKPLAPLTIEGEIAPDNLEPRRGDG